VWDSYQNIYIPDLDTKPTSFCQQVSETNTNTIFMTSKNASDTYMFESTLKDIRRNDINTKFFDMLLRKEQTNTLFYKAVSDYGKSSLSQVVSSMSPDQYMNLFEPQRNFRGMYQNYIAEI